MDLVNNCLYYCAGASRITVPRYFKWKWVEISELPTYMRNHIASGKCSTALWSMCYHGIEQHLFWWWWVVSLIFWARTRASLFRSWQHTIVPWCCRDVSLSHQCTLCFPVSKKDSDSFLRRQVAVTACMVSSPWYFRESQEGTLCVVWQYGKIFWQRSRSKIWFYLLNTKTTLVAPSVDTLYVPVVP